MVVPTTSQIFGVSGTQGHAPQIRSWLGFGFKMFTSDRQV